MSAKPLAFVTALIALSLIVASAEALCPMTTWCAYHGTQATRVRTEVRNGKTFAFFEHSVFEHGRTSKHTFTEVCD
ncbi:MAG: hypothetical protein QM736_16610 [Vicinamibacterales bacterium]